MAKIVTIFFTGEDNILFDKFERLVDGKISRFTETVREPVMQRRYDQKKFKKKENWKY